MRLIGATALLSALLVTTGCTNDDAKSPAQPADPSDSASVAASDSPSATKAPTKVAARPYFAALAKEDTTAMQRAARQAAPGSLAQAYIRHQANGTTAQLDGGEDVSAGTVTEQGSGYKVCYPEEKGNPCYTYDEFKADSKGRLASFSINHKSLRGRVVLGSGRPVHASTAKITVLSAYQTASGYMTVAVKIRTKATGIAFFDPVATYRAPNGQQRANSGQSGLTDFAAHSSGTELYYFKGPLKFGGTITLQTASHSGGDNYGDAVNVTAKVGY